MMNEIKNQHVHVLWGLIACLAIYQVSNFPYWGGLIVGSSVEAYQLFVKKEGLKLADRVLDLFFWALSGLLFFVFMKGMK